MTAELAKAKKETGTVQSAKNVLESKCIVLEAKAG